MLIGEDLIQIFLRAGPYLKDIFGKDVMVWVSDREKVLGYFPGDNFNVDTGDIYLAKDDPMYLAMEQKETLRSNISEEMFGIPFKEVDNPIYDDRLNVVGCITVGVSLDDETKVIKMANNLDESIEIMKNSIEAISASAEDIRNKGSEVRDSIINISEVTNKINKTLASTKNIASQTFLLGVNASIEASRAGVYGAGFNIIADEIRKLSMETTETVKMIGELIEEINKASLNADKCSKVSFVAAKSQVSEILDVSKQVEELSEVSKSLAELSKTL